MIKYRIESWGYSPFARVVEVERETEHFVYLRSGPGRRQRREAKHTDYYAYFDTWDEARDWLVKVWEHKVGRAAKALEDANSRLDAIRLLEPPKREDAA